MTFCWEKHGYSYINAWLLFTKEYEVDKTRLKKMVILDLTGFNDDLFCSEDENVNQPSIIMIQLCPVAVGRVFCRQ